MQYKYLPQQRGFNAEEVLEHEHTIEILRELVETLKQELQYERQIVKEYRQELLCTNLEMSTLNNELQDLRKLEIVKLNESKRLAQNIIGSNTSIIESMAQLLSAIFDIRVTVEELEPIKNIDSASPRT